MQSFASNVLGEFLVAGEQTKIIGSSFGKYFWRIFKNNSKPETPVISKSIIPKSTVAMTISATLSSVTNLALLQRKQPLTIISIPQARF